VRKQLSDKASPQANETVALHVMTNWYFVETSRIGHSERAEPDLAPEVPTITTV
jgi:hypothetical protein